MEGVIKKEDKEYPKLLREIKEAPQKLYYKGNWNREIFEKCLAVVGSRRLTSYGRRVTEELVGEIAAAGITIVSGFMYGGDEAGHRAALKVGGRTIAVLPCGIELIHPQYQEELYNQILKSEGLIISEFEGNFPPALWTYPKRNRIVAGLSKAVLIVEAGLNSGSLITAAYAKKFKRKIFAVPGPITSSVSLGTAQLIKEGATLVSSAKEILEYYGLGWKSVSEASQEIQISRLERRIIAELQNEPLDIDTIARTLQLPASEIGTLLSLMELRGIISQENGKYYVN